MSKLAPLRHYASRVRVRALLLLPVFNLTATTEIYTLSLHDALPIFLADFDAAEDRRAGSDCGAAPDDRRNHRPVAVALQLAGGGDGSRESIVDERHAVADEDVILDLDAFADERVARNFHAPSNLRALLNLDERADAALVADLASVEIDEIVDPDVSTQLHVVRDCDAFHIVIRRPSLRSDCSAASSIETTRMPAAAPVIGSRRSAIADANSAVTSDSASRRSCFGAYMSPVRYETRIWRRAS